MTDADEGPGEDSEPVGWLGSVGLEGHEEDVQVVYDGRDGNTVYVRQADPADVDPQRVPLFDGDQVVLMQALSHISHHLDSEGVEVYLLPCRIVPVRSEGDTVYVRTLKRGEKDDGHRVHVRPGGKVSFETGALTVELDAIDDFERRGDDGYAPLTPVLWTWLRFFDRQNDGRERFLLSAARRLDTAHRLLLEVEQARTELADAEAGPDLRRCMFRIVGSVEVAVVALGRVVDMAEQSSNLLGSNLEIPASIRNKAQDIREIRNAYEHIEDRSFGRIRTTPDPVALTIFDHGELVANKRIQYGAHSLEMAVEVPDLLRETRQFFKDLVSSE